jgi:MinD superfamily P-loop ATPase
MKEIVVISGKGGTGKTSITASFAAIAGSDVIMADCDVDASDLHLLLNPKVLVTENFYSGYEAIIDSTKCTGCGRCFDVCRFKAVVAENNIFSVDPMRCEGCGYCARICPADAIKMEEALSGEVYESISRFNVPMVHAKLGVAAENSGKLVAKVKEKARKLIGDKNISWIIVDGSPGIGCPVVSSLSNADFVVLVTEPSVSGIHDAKRVHEVVARFSIPIGCIINKYDINTSKTDEIIDYLQENNIPLLGKIPYSKVFPTTLTEGITVVEGKDEQVSELIKEAWGKIKSLA